MSDKELLKQFCVFLDQQLGLYYPPDRWPELEKKLQQMKNSCGFDQTDVYLRWIMQPPVDKKKIDFLVLNLTVGETYFFRDTQVYAILEQEIIPDIIQRCKKQRSIKVWSAACCTGEEAYSIAILLHRLMPDLKDWKVSILGTDVNADFLRKAEKAEYKKWSFRNTPANIMESYFNKNKDEMTFRVMPQIRKMVTFKSHNLTKHTYPNLSRDFNAFDLIFCHNVLIYFSKNQVKKTLHFLTDTLSENGWLSVSAIETAFVAEINLKPQNYAGTVFFKKKTVPKTTPQIALLAPQPLIKVTNQDDLFDKCLHLYKQKAYQEVILCLQPYLTFCQNDSMAIKEYNKEIILLIRTYANQGDLNLAVEWSEKLLQADELNPTHHYLHAILLQDQGKISEAIKSIKKVLFIDPNFMMAYLVLGILEKQQGNKPAALRNFKVALELLNNHLPEDILLHAEEFTTEYLKDIISNNIESLQGTEG